MSKIITVVGATGVQGGSVVSSLLGDSVFSIRAITRNSKSDAARALADKGVEVVEADVNDVTALRSAFTGSHAIFAVTNFFELAPIHGVEKAMEIETSLGVNLADAAAATESLEHYIWSTLPNSRQNSGGRVVVPYYESKNRVDKHIQSVPRLLGKTTFLWCSWYTSNILNPIFRPSLISTMDSSKSYVQFLSVPPSTPLPLLGDERTNIGLFVKAILEQPQKTLPGKFVAAIAEESTFSGTLSSFASSQGVQAHCIQISKEDYSKLWPSVGDTMNASLSYLEILGRKAFTSTEGEVLTKDDLGVKGLVSTAEAYASMCVLS